MLIYKSVVTCSTDLALDETVYRLGAIQTGLNMFYQKHLNVHGELNSGLTEALSAFKFVKAAKRRCSRPA